MSESVLLGSAILVTASTLGIALASPATWVRLGREDGLVEIAGALAFLVLAFVAARRIIRSPSGCRAPSVAGVFAGVLGAGEEVSWGQRIFDIQPPPFFSTHNVQGEINFHNLLHPPWDAALAAVLFLGFCLAPLWRERSWVRRLRRRGLPWPRPIHIAVLVGCVIVGLAVAAVTEAKDLEEIGELFFVLIVAAVWSGDPISSLQPPSAGELETSSLA